MPVKRRCLNFLTIFKHVGVVKQSVPFSSVFVFTSNMEHDENWNIWEAFFWKEALFIDSLVFCKVFALDIFFNLFILITEIHKTAILLRNSFSYKIWLIPALNLMKSLETENFKAFISFANFSAFVLKPRHTWKTVQSTSIAFPLNGKLFTFNSVFITKWIVL